MQSSLNFDSTQPNTLSTSAEPDAMENSDAPNKGRISGARNLASGALITSEPKALPTATAEGSSIPTLNLGQRGVAGGAASNYLPSALEARLTIKAQIYQFFQANMGKRFSSRELHWRFGSAVRTRISDINNDADLKLNIKNEIKWLEGQEHSCYWAELR